MTLQILKIRRPCFLTDDVVTELPETRQLRRAVGAHVQDVPDILIGALKTAEPEDKTIVLNSLNSEQGPLRGRHYLMDTPSSPWPPHRVLGVMNSCLTAPLLLLYTVMDTSFSMLA